MKLHHAAAATLLVATFAAQATTVVFADNFDANVLGLNVAPAGWSVSQGTVDVIGTANFYDFIPGSGRYVDLDGSTNNAGVLAKTFALTAGMHYTASFELAGNHRNSERESVKVKFGNESGTYSLSQNVGWTSYSLLFTPHKSGNFALSFDNRGGDNIGMLLDNVRVTAVPEPGTYALMGLGLFAVGAIARKRKLG